MKRIILAICIALIISIFNATAQNRIITGQAFEMQKLTSDFQEVQNMRSKIKSAEITNRENWWQPDTVCTFSLNWQGRINTTYKV